MLNEEESMEIAVLSKQGNSLRAISKATGRSINTVRKYASGKIKPKYKSRPQRPRKLEPFENYIKERLEAASPNWIPATVMYREIKSQGYSGEIRQLRYFMSALKPKSIAAPIIRYETDPGEQIQIDWGHFRFGLIKLYAFVAILGYSRAAYVEFRKDMSIDALLNCHENMFNYYGGVTKNILYDNMKTVVIERNAYGPGQHRLHSKLYDFAKHYGFVPKLCKPYRPQTKGKVERFIRYLRGSFFVPLIATLKKAGLSLDKETANLEVINWLNDVANNRFHSTIKTTPNARLKTERKALQPVPTIYNGHSLEKCIPEENSVEFLKLINFEVEQHDLQIYESLIGGQ